MAFMAGAIYGKLGLDTSGFTSGMVQAHSVMAVFPQWAQNFLASPLLGVMGLARQAAGHLANVARGAIGGGVKLAADYEQATVAFEVMLKSADKSGKLLKELKDFAAATPFEFPELVGAARKLVAFGVSGEQTINTLRMIGDVAAGIQAPIGEIAEIFGKAKVQGRLFAEDINQFAGRGIPIIQELARQFGVTGEQVKGLVEKGTVNFTHLEAAFKAMAGRGGQFAGMMDRQSRTLAGLWSTMKDTWGQLTQVMATPITDALKPMLDKLIKWIGDNPALIEERFRAMGQSLAEALQMAAKAAAWAAENFSLVTKAVIGLAAWKTGVALVNTYTMAMNALTAATNAATAAQLRFNAAKMAGAALGGAAIGMGIGGMGFGGPGGVIGGSVGGVAGGLIGQALIPIPGVGFLIGSAAGGLVGSWIGSKFNNDSSGQPGVVIQNVNVAAAVDAKDTARQIADKIHPGVQAVLDQQQRRITEMTAADVTRRGLELR